MQSHAAASMKSNMRFAKQLQLFWRKNLDSEAL